MLSVIVRGCKNIPSTFRLLETRREELILVLLQDIPRRKCPKTLSYLLKTKTYIKWPTGSVHEQALFWKRLHKALSTSRC